METLPSIPPAKMPFAMALEYARRGFYIRPGTWTGADSEPALAWLHFPYGYPLAYFWDGSGDFPGRKWAATDLDIEDWFRSWTVLPPSCFTDANVDLCLCGAVIAGEPWAFALYDDETIVTEGEDVSNPNAIMGIGECGQGCDCAPQAAGSEGGTTEGSSIGSTSTGGGGGGGGSGSGIRKRTRKTKPIALGPAISLSAALNSPNACIPFETAGTPVNHTWSVDVTLGAGTDAAYSVKVVVLGQVWGQRLMRPGDTAVVTVGPIALLAGGAVLPCVAHGAAFGGGAACVPDRIELTPQVACAPATPGPTPTPSPTPSDPPEPSATPTPSPAFYPHVLNYNEHNSDNACSFSPPGGTTYWSPDAVLGDGSYLYTTNTGGTPVADGFYSDSFDWWRVTLGNGLIQDLGSCPPPTPPPTVSPSPTPSPTPTPPDTPPPTPSPTPTPTPS